jgi:hypothetical protein
VTGGSVWAPRKGRSCALGQLVQVVVGTVDANASGLRGAPGHGIKFHPRVAAILVAAHIDRIKRRELPKLFRAAQGRAAKLTMNPDFVSSVSSSGCAFAPLPRPGAVLEPTPPELKDGRD